jgi:hypothetical protein
MKSISLPWFCFVRGGDFGAAAPPPLVGKEDRHENDGCGDAEADSEASLIGAEQAGGKQCHAGTGNNAIDEGDHRGGRREKRDERAGPEPQYVGACHGAVTKISPALTHLVAADGNPGRAQRTRAPERRYADRSPTYRSQPAGPNMNVKARQGRTRSCGIPRSSASRASQPPTSRSKAR